MKRFNQTWPSGAESGAGDMTRSRAKDSRNDSVFTPIGLWLTQRLLNFSGRYSARLSPREVTGRTDVGLAPNPNLDLVAQWPCFFIQWVFWPDEHYRRYLPNEDLGYYGATIYHATTSDDAIFLLLPKVVPINILEISQSKVTGHAIEQIAKVKSLSILVLDSVEAESAELAPLGTLNAMDDVQISFARPVHPEDMAFLNQLPHLNFLTLTAPSFDPGCDAVSADLIKRNKINEVFVVCPHPQPSFDLTKQAAETRSNAKFRIQTPIVTPEPHFPSKTITPDNQ